MITSETLLKQIAVMQAMGSVFTNKYAEGYQIKILWWMCEFAYRYIL